MKKKKKHKNVFYNQLTQITRINNYVNKNITYFKLQKIVNYRKSHSERDINLNNNIQTKNWKIYANNLFEQNIIKNALQIIIIVFLCVFWIKNYHLRFVFIFDVQQKNSISVNQKKTKINFSADNNINVNLFQTLQRTFKSEKKYRSKSKSFSSKFALKSSTKKNKDKKKATRIILNKKSTIAKTVRSNKDFTTDIIETLNIKNCFCSIVSDDFFELWMKNVIITTLDNDFETIKLLLIAYIYSEWKNDICFEHCQLLKIILKMKSCIFHDDIKNSLVDYWYNLNDISAYKIVNPSIWKKK